MMGKPILVLLALALSPFTVVAQDNGKKESALFEAVFLSHASEVERLLNAGESPSAKGPDGVPLLSTVIGRDSYVRALLLASGADANAVDREGRTPLFYVAFDKSRTMGGRIPSDDDAFLAVCQLLSAGADPSHKDKAGKDFLFYMSTPFTSSVKLRIKRLLQLRRS
jgi:ankyrin repeat protein